MTFYAWLTAHTAHSGALGDFARWATAPAIALPHTIDTLDALTRWLREQGKATYVPLAKLVLTAYYYWGHYSLPTNAPAFHVVWQEGSTLYRSFLSGHGPHCERVGGVGEPEWRFSTQREWLDWRAARRQWDAFMEEAAHLPQLFIAA